MNVYESFKFYIALQVWWKEQRKKDNRRRPLLQYLFGGEGRLSSIQFSLLQSEAPMRAEFLQKRLISAFFGFQWQNLAEILRLFKKYNNLRKVAVRE